MTESLNSRQRNSSKSLFSAAAPLATLPTTTVPHQPTAKSPHVTHLALPHEQLMQVSLLARRRIQLPSTYATAVFWRRYGDDGGKRGNTKWNGKAKRGVRDGVQRADNQSALREPKQPSLFEQLFPDQQAPNDAPRSKDTNVPPVPPLPEENVNESGSTRPQRVLRKRGARDETTGAVVVLRNASKSLVEDDFRRLIPTGAHIEGWTMGPGDILKVIPGRDSRTLQQENYYFLLFSNAASAWYFFNHAYRVKKLVAQHTPSHLLSPTFPPSGYLVQGLDANQAIESFTLVPPNQKLELTKPVPPYTPVVDLIVKEQGYPVLTKRKDRSPFEARLTLEGPQLHKHSIGHILMLSGKDRGLSWSGNEEPIPKITDWDVDMQFRAPPAESTGKPAWNWAYRMARGVLNKSEDSPEEQGREHEQEQEQEKKWTQRTGEKIFILGFHTENAMQSFVRYWHRRPLKWAGISSHHGVGEDGDLAPIVKVEVLW